MAFAEIKDFPKQYKENWITGTNNTYSREAASSLLYDHHQLTIENKKAMFRREAKQYRVDIKVGKV